MKAQPSSGSYRGNLVKVEDGLISRQIFVDEHVYADEQSRIFTMTWLFVGHESQVQKTGDFFVSRMGEESVILTRDTDGTLKVFLNSCRHRGMKVCRYDEGNTPVFTCSYHGWSYGLDGSLRGVPRFKDAYFGELDKSKWGLLRARVETYRGTIWATWNTDAPPLIDYLGPACRALDAMLDSTDGGDGQTEVLPGVQRWIVPCNWKFVSENFAGDFYHSPSHVSVELTGIGPEGKPGRASSRPGESSRHGNSANLKRSLTSVPSLGHAWGGGFLPEDDNREVYPFPEFADPDVDAYFRKSNELWRERRGNEPPGWIRSQPGTIFPNMSFHMRFPRTIIVAHPADATTTQLWRWYVVDKEAPDFVKAHLRRYFLRYSGPAGMTEQDDMENWNYATAASKGTMARRLDYNYQQGLGHWHEHPVDGRMRVSDALVSESNALSFYGRWCDYMDGSAS